MKFDVFTWEEVKTNVQIESPKGWLRLRLSAPCPLYIEAEGYEALAGFGASFDLETSEAVSFRVEAPKGVRAFRHSPLPTSTVAEGEVFTNADRMPHESGMMAEVTRARRLFELERRSALAEIRRETAIMKAQVSAKAEAKEAEAGEAEAEAKAEGEAEGGET